MKMVASGQPHGSSYAEAGSIPCSIFTARTPTIHAMTPPVGAKQHSPLGLYPRPAGGAAHTVFVEIWKADYPRREAHPFRRARALKHLRGL